MFSGECGEYHPENWQEAQTQRVQASIWHIRRPEVRIQEPPSRPMYMLYGYVDALGNPSVGLHKCLCHAEAYLSYELAKLYEEYGTIILVILQAPTMNCKGRGDSQTCSKKQRDPTANLEPPSYL